MEPTGSPGSKETWDIRKHGMAQLDQLNAMERQQDSNLWMSSAIFSATNGVLILALLAGIDNPLLVILLGGIGLIVTIVWDRTVARAHMYEHLWINKAKKLQNDLEVPPTYSVWDDEAPRGGSARIANRFLRTSFAFVWLLVLAYGVAFLVAMAYSGRNPWCFWCVPPAGLPTDSTPLVGGLFALLGASLVSSVALFGIFSTNRRESVAAAERQLHAWQAIVFGTKARDVAGGVETDWSTFTSQGPFLSGDSEAWPLHYEISKSIAEFYDLDANQKDKYDQLQRIAWGRITHFARIVEDMKRRSVWTFHHVEYVSNPADYQFQKLT